MQCRLNGATSSLVHMVEARPHSRLESSCNDLPHFHVRCSHALFTDQPAVEDMLVESGFYARHFDVSCWCRLQKSRANAIMLRCQD